MKQFKGKKGIMFLQTVFMVVISVLVPILSDCLYFAMEGYRQMWLSSGAVLMATCFTWLVFFSLWLVSVINKAKESK